VSPARRREPGERATRTAVMLAAARLIGERGVDAVSVQQIATAAGYTKGAFYSNFASKDEMATALLDEVFARVIARIDEHLAGEGEPRDEVRQTAADFIHWAGLGEWSNLYFQLAAHAAGHAPFRRRFAERWRQMRAQLAALFARWAAGVGEPPLPIESIVAMICLLSDGFLLERVIEPQLSEEQFTIALGVLYRGLEALAAERRG